MHGISRIVVATLCLIVAMFGSGTATAAPRDLLVNGTAAGVVNGDASQGPTAVWCTARALGQTIVTTSIQSCTITSSLGGSVRGVTPAIAPGPFVATAGAGSLRLGTHTICVTARATYALPAETISKTKCTTYS